MGDSQLPGSASEKQKWRHGRAVANEILWDEWDPIGLNAMTDAPNDEYQSYADAAVAKARSGNDVQDIASFLTKIAREHIGMADFPHELSISAAGKIVGTIRSKG